MILTDVSANINTIKHYNRNNKEQPIIVEAVGGFLRLIS